MTGSLVVLTEEDLLSQIKELAECLGWAVYHTRDSRRSDKGWPDLVLCRPPVLLFRELKTTTGVTKAEQTAWLHRLRESGADVGIWRPADLRGGRVAAELSRDRRDRHGGPVAARVLHTPKELS